jgi:hypothetical protein
MMVQVRNQQGVICRHFRYSLQLKLDLFHNNGNNYILSHHVKILVRYE